MTNRVAKELLLAAGVGLTMVAVTTLASKPAARSLLVMRVASVSRRFCQANADFWQGLATSCAQTYNKARL